MTQKYLSKILYRKSILSRLSALSNYEKIGIPFKKFGKYYFYKNSGLQNQSVLYVQDSLGGKARVFFDVNKLSTDGTVALKGLSFSHDGKYASYIISRSGSDWQEIYVIDVATGRQIGRPHRLASFRRLVAGDAFLVHTCSRKGKEFSNMNQGIKIYFHKIGTPQSEDKLYYQNLEHPKRFYTIDVNKDETMMFLEESGEGSGNNIYIKDLTKPDAEFVQATTDMNYTYSPFDNIGSKIFILTNFGAPKNRIMITDVNHPAMKDWQVLVPETENVLSSAEIIGGKLFITYSKDASDHAYVYSLDGKLEHEINLPSLGSVGFSGEKDEKDCFYISVHYHSGRI